MTNITRKRKRSKSINREEREMVLEKAKRIIDFVFTKYRLAEKTVSMTNFKQG